MNNLLPEPYYANIIKIKVILKNLILFIFISITNTNIYPQLQKKYPSTADTSYSAYSEFIKYRKEFPFISIAGIGDTSEIKIFRDIVYAKYDNRLLHLDVITPNIKNQDKRPVIILIHGGGWRSGNKMMEWPMAFELARRGYSTVCVEYRLSGEALYPSAVSDVQASIRWVRANAKTFNFDTKRIVIQGNSAGGQIAALLGSINRHHKRFTNNLYKKFSSRVDAVVNIDGILAFIHPESGEGQDKPGKLSAATLWFGSPVTEDSVSRIEASALNHVNKKSAPILFLNSSIPRFHSGRDDMTVLLKEYKIYTSVHEFKNTMHTFWLFNPWFIESVEIIDKFLKNVL